MKCRECKNADICLDHREEKRLFGCTSGEPDRKVATNADRIRSMTDEELAFFLCEVKADYQWVDQRYPDEDAAGDWEEWLRSESEVGKDA